MALKIRVKKRIPDYTILEKYPISKWKSPEVFANSGIEGFEPMTAKEIPEEKIDESFLLPTNIVEEKLDGTRALLYFTESGIRIFSRRISKKTGFYVENTDSLPHLRDYKFPDDLIGTIIDGELFIDGKPFKCVSSTLNCLPAKAIQRQEEIGFITLHAFDILYYQGKSLKDNELYKRKSVLSYVVEKVGNPFIVTVPFYPCGLDSYPLTKRELLKLKSHKSLNSYPTLKKELLESPRYLSAKAFYEKIVMEGGEGVIIKSRHGKYYHKRGWEYSKVKKFLTRDLVFMNFSEPTPEYNGKELKTWNYWQHIPTKQKIFGNFFGNKDYTPISKYYYHNFVGNIVLGVYVTVEEYNNIPQNKRGVLERAFISQDDSVLMEVCECSGMTEEEREYFSDVLLRRPDYFKGQVMEVKCNEIMDDSGRLRHPRFLRLRDDKNAEQCVWRDHITQ